MTKRQKEALPKFPCKMCGVCCKKVFNQVPQAAPETARAIRKLDRGDGFCKHFDEETNKCKIYQKRPWFCNGVELWRRYYKPNGLPLEAAYAVMKRQCEVLAEKDTLEDDDFDWGTIFSK